MMVARRRLADLITALRLSLGRYRRVLAERNAALLLGTGFVSEIGDWFNTVALISLSFQFGEGALGVGGLLAVRMLPRLALQGPAGTLVDRRPGRALLVATQLSMAVVAGFFAFLTVVPSLWLLYLLVLLLESFGTVARPAFMAQLKVAVPAEQRAAANGALFAAMTVAQFAGPLLGALVLAPFDPAAVFVVNGLTFLGVAIAVTQLRDAPDAEAETRLAGAPPSEEAAEPRSAEGEEAAPLGYRWLVRRPDLSLYAVVSLLVALLVQATIALFVLRANALGLGDGGVGIFYAAVAVGAFLGSLLAGASSQGDRTALARAAVAMAACALALATFGVADSPALAVAVLVVAGFTTDFHEVTALTYFQNELPDAVFGRFFSLFLITLSAGGLVGALLGPVLERSVGVGVALALLSAPAVCLAVGFAGVLTGRVPSVRRSKG